MKRAPRLLLNACLVAAMSPTILAQDVTNPRPEPPSSDILGPQLIAWSALQKPQPLNQPGSEFDRSQRPSPQPDRAWGPAASAETEKPDIEKPDTEKKDKPQGNK
jgi:hypothetical protein